MFSIAAYSVCLRLNFVLALFLLFTWRLFVILPGVFFSCLCVGRFSPFSHGVVAQWIVADKKHASTY